MNYVAYVELFTLAHIFLNFLVLTDNGTSNNLSLEKKSFQGVFDTHVGDSTTSEYYDLPDDDIGYTGTTSGVIVNVDKDEETLKCFMYKYNKNSENEQSVRRFETIGK